jgi:hypothetical protein
VSLAPPAPPVNGRPFNACGNGTAGNGRAPSGRFVKGCSGGPGRPPRPTEQRYLATMMSACSLDDWKAITLRAVEDAKQGSAAARDWLSKYLLGQPMAAAPSLTEAIAGQLTGDDVRGVAIEFARQVQAGCEEAVRHKEGLFEVVKQTVAERLGTLDVHV